MVLLFPDLIVIVVYIKTFNISCFLFLGVGCSFSHRSNQTADL